MTNKDTRLDGVGRNPIERLEKFATEWGVLIAGGRYGNIIYGLHTGDKREAELRHTDLCDVLAMLAALQSPPPSVSEEKES